jgi:aspartyl-tRNA(Asn)/glutamyl-tRNA(Gln) amidotransferase subunit C
LALQLKDSSANDVVDTFATTFLLDFFRGEVRAMHLTTNEVRHVAELAKLRLTDDEIRQYTEQLSAILDYAEILQQVDTSHVPPTPYVLPIANVMGDDIARPSLTNEEALANAPDAAHGFFRVAAVFEE